MIGARSDPLVFGFVQQADGNRAVVHAPRHAHHRHLAVRDADRLRHDLIARRRGVRDERHAAVARRERDVTAGRRPCQLAADGRHDRHRTRGFELRRLRPQDLRDPIHGLLRITEAGAEVMLREAGIFDAAFDGRTVRRLAGDRPQRRDLSADADERIVDADEHGAALDERARHARDDGAGVVQKNLTHGIRRSSAC